MIIELLDITCFCDLGAVGGRRGHGASFRVLRTWIVKQFSLFSLCLLVHDKYMISLSCNNLYSVDLLNIDICNAF